MEIILTHDNADFDAVASLLGAHKLYPQATPVLPCQVNRNVAEFIELYQTHLPFVDWRDLSAGHIERLILVDTQNIPPVKGRQPETPVLIIDHHPLEHDFPPYVTYAGEEIGAAATLLVERIRAQKIPLTAIEATLLALGIYGDTGSLTYGRTTPRDVQAAAWLLEQKAALDTVRNFLDPPLNDEQLTLFDQLIAAVDMLRVGGHTVAISAIETQNYVPQINSVAHRLRDLLDPDALILVVQMPPGALQMVCRSNTDAVDVGAIARYFGGGGHTRAAAAHIKGMALDEVMAALREQVEQATYPVTRVADLMSYGTQTVAADQKLAEVIQHLRRIGHEGYPVVDGDRQVIGLLTLRDADRALEHGLEDALVRDVMIGGRVTLRPEDFVSTLEQVMVQSGWGQIPVVDDGDNLIGIVTRTDLINFWGKTHPARPAPEHRVEDEQMVAVLGEPVVTLIHTIAHYAHQHKINMYLVGGIVRDLLLERPNLDIDLVIEGDAIQFAEKLRETLGGEVNSYRPFGTAKWCLDQPVGAALRVDTDALPDHIDFASSRNEFYVHPTALPSVYSSSIKLDLHRRDFTINTLAIPLSPERAANRLLDFYGGLNDLRNGIIRVLHSLSFVDDPTRVLRAIRFQQRLGFEIEPRTFELIDTARPMLCRITGERLRNEMKLLLDEDRPERALLIMQERGILAAIHPDLAFSEPAAVGFQKARETQDQWPLFIRRIRHLYWHIMMAYIPFDRLEDVGKRLMFRHSWIDSLVDTARLFQQPEALTDPNAPVSQIVRKMDPVTEPTLLAIWVIGDDWQRDHIQRYVSTWRHIQPVTTGHTLKELGLPPGPRYRVILSRLRDARLDGDIADDEAEAQLLQRLLEEAENETGS